MHYIHLARALALKAAAGAGYLAIPATAQFVRGPIEPATPALPHTAVYTTIATTTVDPQNKSPRQQQQQQQQRQEIIATVVVTLIVPRDVGVQSPNSDSMSLSLVTGMAIAHFSAAGAVSTTTWSETAELLWSTTIISAAGNDHSNKNIPAPKDTGAGTTTLTASYTDYQHYSVGLYGAWSVVHYDFLSTIRETVIEVVESSYPATVLRTGYTDIKIAATIAMENGPTTTDPDRDHTSHVRTTRLVQVGSRVVSRG